VTRDAHVAVARARDQFLAMVEGLRPELHRYCARLTGSVVEGEDVVQDALAKAFYSLALLPEPPPLRPWLFRIAHNAAIDHLKRHERRFAEARADMSDVPDGDDPPDPLVARMALATFLRLPVAQRSAVILKDVLGESLEETAEIMDSTVPAVKSALVRGRSRLRDPDAVPAPLAQDARAELDRYAALFNARDWDGVRALVQEDCRLDLVAKSRRRGKEVAAYFTQYAKAPVTLRVVGLDGRLALAAHVDGAERPSYFILLEWEDGRVRSIRDFRYVPYIATDADLVDV
jgi:RNA polymerase sigma-70 factor (ECF subfamily)